MVTADGAKRRASQAPRVDTAIFDKLPPQDIEAEKSTLGSIMLVPSVIDTVMEIIDAESFYLQAHQHVFTALLDMHEQGKGADPVTLSNVLESRGQLDDVGGDVYLMQLMDTVPHAGNVKYYAEIVREKFLRRSVVYNATESIKQAYDPLVEVGELLSESEQKIHRIIEHQSGAEEISLKDVLVDVLQELESGTVRRIPTGYIDFDKLTAGGLPLSGLNILAARPSVGKTSLACNIALNVAEAGSPVLLFSIEQSKLELAERLLCLVTKIPSHQLRGSLSDDERERILDGASRLSQLPIYIDDRTPQTVTRMGATARLRIRQNGVKLVVVDYLQLIQAEDRRIPREQQVAEITKSLKSQAKSLDVPYLVLAQLNRQVENRDDKRPRLADLRECVVGDTKLIDASSGHYVAIRDVVPGQLVLGVQNQKVIAAPVHKAWRTGVKPVFRLTTQYGSCITATANHPVLTDKGWKTVDSIASGDLVASTFRLPPPIITRSDSFDLCRLMGYLAGNGSYQAHRTLGLIVPDDIAFADACQLVRGRFPDVEIKLRANGYNDAWISRTFANGHGCPGGNPMLNWLREIGVHGHRDCEKFVPQFVFEHGSIGAAEFLSGYFATDGCVTCSKGRWSIRFDTTSRQLASDTRRLLAVLGIASSTGKPSFCSKSKRPLYRTSVCAVPVNMVRFVRSLDVVGRKGDALGLLEAETVSANRRGGVSMFSLPVDVSEAASMGTPWRHQGKRISRQICRRICRDYNKSELDEWCSSDLVWEPVRSIVPDGEQEVFDISIPGMGCFITDGIIAHNSGAIEQDADMVMFLHRPWEYDKNEPETLAEWILGKHRNGQKGPVELHWSAETMMFANASKPWDSGWEEQSLGKKPDYNSGRWYGEEDQQ